CRCGETYAPRSLCPPALHWTAAPLLKGATRRLLFLQGLSRVRGIRKLFDTLSLITPTKREPPPLLCTADLPHQKYTPDSSSSRDAFLVRYGGSGPNYCREGIGVINSWRRSYWVFGLERFAERSAHHTTSVSKLLRVNRRLKYADDEEGGHRARGGPAHIMLGDL
ncbi:unnamed protein product, partial [Ectocarpus sp. 8 AP-2014]